jgi:hypothetical protein
VSHLKIKIPSKNMHEKPTDTSIINSVYLSMYGSSYMFRHYIATVREHSYGLLKDAELRSSRQNIVDERVVSSDVVCTQHAHLYLLSIAPQLSISQKALGMLPEDGNVMPKHVGATIHT